MLRPTLLVGVCLTWLVAGLLATPRASAAANPIQLENAKPGTTAWQLPGMNQAHLNNPSLSIEGYASEISVQPGDVLHMHVSTTPAAAYRIEIFRLGWYHGAGGRRIACLPSCSGSEQGQNQPVPSPDPTTGLLDAGWPVTDTITVGSSWTTGYFIAKLTLVGGPQAGQANYIFFIVRAAPGVRSAILVQASVNTWEAYNSFGGKSLYTFNSKGPVVPASQTVAAAMVSFNRPYGNRIDPFQWEYQRVRFLERMGYDVSYQTDVDTDQNPGSLLAHNLDIVSGHDEYWSPNMRNAYEAALGAGVNLAFLGGNVGFWQMRYANSDSTLVEYRSATLDPNPNPSLKTVQFAQPPVNRPECELLGVGNAGATNPLDPPRSYSVTAAAISNPWFQGTGFSAGDTIYDSVGYEWDQVVPGCAVPPLTVLLHFAGLTGVNGSPATADAVTYTAPSGGQVISDGTMQLAWALDDYGHGPHADARAQRLFTNIFNSLGAVPYSAPPSGQPQLVAPAQGSSAPSPVVFRWSAPTGLQTYQVSVDNTVVATVNATACAAGSCTATLPLSPGPHTWSVLASDGLGNSIASQAGAFTVASSGFSLLTPGPGAVLWSPVPRFQWTAARHRLHGPVSYRVMIDGKPVGTASRTLFSSRRALADGSHAWTVVAVDRAGKRSAPEKWRFIVRSVRLVSPSRGYTLTPGFKLRVYCAQRCSIRAHLQLGHRGPVVGLARRSPRPGIAAIAAPLSRAFTVRWHTVRSARIFIVVNTQFRHTLRTVAFVVSF